MPLYIGTPYRIEGKIEPRVSRNAKGVEGHFIFATPHHNAATAYAFKPTNPELASSPLLVPELQLDQAVGNPYVMIIGANPALYFRGLALAGSIYTLPATNSFKPVASPIGEHVSSDAVDISQCQHETIKLADAIGSSFHVLFGDPQTPAFFTFMEKMIQMNPLEIHGRLLLDQDLMSSAIKEGTLYRIPNREILSAASRQ